MQDSDTDPALCTGEDTCLRHFQYKTNVGRCHKCVLIANTPVAEHDRMNALGQCSGCGNTSARLSTEYCGLCEKKNERRVQNTNLSGAPLVASSDRQAPDPLTSGVRNIGQFHRSQWKDAANFNGSSVKPQQSTIAITGANMATLKSNNLATNECYVFVLEPFVNSKAYIVANGIASFNFSWEDASESSLVRSDMRLSRMNNVHLEIEPQSSFRDVFHATLKDCGQNLDKTVPTKFRNRKFATLYMEAHIDVAKFHSRTGVPPPPGLFKSKKRVWNENNSVSLGSSVLKRTRLASGGIHHLKSSFALAAPATPATLVTLFFAKQTSDPETGVQSFNWSTTDATAHSARIETDIFSKGRSKLVFKVQYNNMAYVAKRCYTIGHGQTLSLISNRDELIKEATTLGRAKFFLNNFNNGYFDVTDFILAREGVVGSTDPFNPSPASGLTQSGYAELSGDVKGELSINNGIITSITWLLERERGNVQFRKYSGTLEHPRYTDKQGATVNAFQHFTYINSNKALVLADIQSSESHDASNKSAILFDLMSHTLTGSDWSSPHPRDSGAGDHGDKGIQTFVDQHECGQRCVQLGLQLLKEAVEEE
ncbi:kinase-like domain-containing protein [Mycena galericulata]|nr:kinase-like domain-containing protein [Mycena galericulata]